MQLVETAKLWYKKASTWLAASMGTALLTYAILPDKIQESFPDWFLFAVGAIVMFGLPAAVQVKQPKLEAKLAEMDKKDV